jgi:hypothetical protein
VVEEGDESQGSVRQVGEHCGGVIVCTSGRLSFGGIKVLHRWWCFFPREYQIKGMLLIQAGACLFKRMDAEADALELDKIHDTLSEQAHLYSSHEAAVTTITPAIHSDNHVI